MEGGSINKSINSYIKSIKSEYDNLNIYQEITARYFTSRFMNKSDMLLLYWDMGSGKTIGSLLCAIRALEEGSKHDYKQIIILSPKSIQVVFDVNLKRLCNLIYETPMKKSQMYNYYKSKIYMIPYNAWNSNEQLDDLGNLEKTIFIIDEVHLFIKSVIKVNITPENMKTKRTGNKGNAKRMYDRIRKLKDKKILCLSGTPLAKFSFEMVPLFNLAHRDVDLFKENYIEFQQKYYDNVSEKLRSGAEDSILKRIDGMVSYVPPIDTGVKVSSLKEVLVEMSVGQFKQYVYDYALELQENAFSNDVNMFGMPFGSISTYHTKTFQDCLYWNSELDISDFNEVVFGSGVIKGGSDDSDELGSDELDSDNNSDELVSDELVSDELVSDELVSDESVSDNNNSEESISEESISEESISEESISEESTSEESIDDEYSDDSVSDSSITSNDSSEEDTETSNTETSNTETSNTETSTTETSTTEMLLHLSEYLSDNILSQDDISTSTITGGSIPYHTNMAEYLKAKMKPSSISNDEERDYSSEERHKIKRFIIDKAHCPKLIKMYEDSLQYEGIKCFYFRLTKTYGCDTMEKLLQKEGYSLADPDNALNTKDKRYVLFTGNISQDRRNEFVRLVNNKKNAHGEYIQYVILSPSGQVGISLMNVRFLGIGTAEFAYSSLLQIQTRCVRFKSHDALDPKDRTLDQKIYFSSPNKSFFKKYEKKLSELLSRTDPLIKNEKHPSIERIIYYNSIHDDIPMQAFRKLLYKASITEKLFKFSSR